VIYIIPGPFFTIDDPVSRKQNLFLYTWQHVSSLDVEWNLTDALRMRTDEHAGTIAITLHRVCYTVISNTHSGGTIHNNVKKRNGLYSREPPF
jgi:1,6-anhydro-N-acetylmuramate kinase